MDRYSELMVFTRAVAEGDEGLDEDEPGEQPAGPVENAAEGDEIEHAQRADLPLIQLNTERLLSEMVPKPVVPHTDEKDADESADLINETGRPPERAAFLGGDGADAQAGYPDHLPGEEVKGAGVLQRNLQSSDMNDHMVNPRTQAELRKQPDRPAGQQDAFPASVCRDGKEKWRDQQKNYVHRQDIEQRRAIDEQKRADNSVKWMCEIEVEQVDQRKPVRQHGEGCTDGEGEREQDQVIAVYAQCALPELCPQSDPGLSRLPAI